MAVTLIQLLQLMVQSKGSDLHIATSSVPMIRVRGEMVKVDVPPLQSAEIEAMVGQIITSQQKMDLATSKSLDFAFKASGVGIFRVNVFTQRHGLSIVMRVLSENPPTLSELNAPPICETACQYANGLVLVCGPTGSGKSTTLAAMLNYINMTTKGHILTLEDPIEFQHESKMCMVNQRSLGSHFTDFPSALKAALREDPDVILVGEMRDPETMALAIKAAETGHLVFSTLHTNSASKTVDRIINSFPAEEQAQIRTVLAENLKVVIAQKLIPSADRKRRICFHDILVNNSAVANLIRENKTFQILTAMQTGRKEGMQILDQVLLEAVQSNLVAGEDAFEFANDKALFTRWGGKSVAIGKPMVSGTSSQVQPPAPAGGTSPGSVPGIPGARPVVKKAA
ncbi:MAG: type IV pilus twitching motility protein PilT [Oligoflexia bacterium]|nr:type IV pilus twitching motility protein PilT [Oligoflexia bacterium]